MPTPRPETKWTVYLDERHLVELERRGARSDRTHSASGRSSVLRRRLDLLSEMLASSDPRETHGLPGEYVRLVVELLPDAHELPLSLVKVLDAHLARLRALPAAAAAGGVDCQEFLKAIRKLPCAQRFFLVDLAEQENARGGEPLPPPPASRGRRSRR